MNFALGYLDLKKLKNRLRNLHELFVKSLNDIACRKFGMLGWNQWDQKHQQKVIIFPTCNIVHPCIDVVALKYVQDIPICVCNRNQAKKDLHRYLFFLIDSDHNYRPDEI